MWFSAIRGVTGQPFFILIALFFLKGRDTGQAVRAGSCFWEDWLLPLLDTPIPQLELLALLVHTLQAWLLPIMLPMVTVPARAICRWPDPGHASPLSSSVLETMM